MHPRSLIAIALLLAAGATQAADRPAPPAQDASLSAPAPPAPPAHPHGPPPPPPAPPAPGAMPAPPAPPAPPPPPRIPTAANDACAGKAVGSTLTLQPSPGETLRGVCKRVDGRMVFEARSHQVQR